MLNWRPRALPRPLCKRQFWITKTKQVTLAHDPPTAKRKFQQLLCQHCQDWHDDADFLTAGCQSVCSILPQPHSQNSRPRLAVQHHTTTGCKPTSHLASNHNTLQQMDQNLTPAKLLRLNVICLQDVFGLFMWVFRRLENPSSPSYQLTLSVLDNISQVRGDSFSDIFTQCSARYETQAPGFVTADQMLFAHA